MNLSFSPDGKRLATVSRSDSTAKIRDTAIGAELMTLAPQRDVYDITFSPDGYTLVARCVDGIILWETAEPTGGYLLRETGQVARTLVHTLYEEHGLYHDVVDALQADVTLMEPVRKLALQIAKIHVWEDVTEP